MQELTTFISNHPALFSALIVALLILLVLESLRAKRKSYQLTPAQAVNLINRDHATVIDLRPKDDFKSGHIIEAQSLTADEMRLTPKKLEKFKSKPLILACQGGMESQKLAARLIKEGYNAYAIAGGLRAWKEAQLPLVKE